MMRLREHDSRKISKKLRPSSGRRQQGRMWLMNKIGTFSASVSTVSPVIGQIVNQTSRFLRKRPNYGSTPADVPEPATIDLNEDQILLKKLP